MPMIRKLHTQANPGTPPASRNVVEFGRVAIQYVLPALILMFCLGCNKGLVYKPSNLPDYLAAKPVISATHLNLSGLSSGAIDVNSVYPGDVLQVTVVTGAEDRSNTNWRLRVDEHGEILLPQAGPIRVAGLELIAAERLIADVYRERQIYLHPSVILTVEARKTKRVTVDGAVKKPGDFDIPSSNADLKAALLAAGGLTNEADTVVEVRQVRRFPGSNLSSANERESQYVRQASFQDSSRSQIDIQHIDLSAINSDDGSSHMLEDGAVVTVAKRPTPAVSVVGLVRNSKELEFPTGRELRVLSAIAAAGGTNADFADKVYVVRRVPDSDETVIIKTSIKQAKRDHLSNFLLAPGDVVSVEETPPTFAWRGLTNILNSAFTAVRLYTFPF